MGLNLATFNPSVLASRDGTSTGVTHLPIYGTITAQPLLRL